jgi:hypothetical protein
MVPELHDLILFYFTGSLFAHELHQGTHVAAHLEGSLTDAAFLKMQGASFFRGYTKLCKGLAVILLLVHLLVQLFP